MQVFLLSLPAAAATLSIINKYYEPAGGFSWPRRRFVHRDAHTPPPVSENDPWKYQKRPFMRVQALAAAGTENQSLCILKNSS